MDGSLPANDYEKDLLDLLHACTVRVSVPGDPSFGTGVLVAPGRVLTCAHVVEGAFSRSLRQIPRPDIAPGIAVDVLGQHGSYTAYLRSYWPEPAGPDLALLELADGEQAASSPYVTLDGAIHLRDLVYCYGFANPKVSGHEGGHPTELAYEGDTAGSFPLLQFKEGQVIPGMSGGALLNLRTGAVCGLLARTRDERIALGGQGVTLAVILAALPDLAGTTPHPLWKQTQVAYLRGLESRGAYDVTRLANPYLGLASYSYRDRDAYAGRKHETDEAVRRLAAAGAPAVLFVRGASGSGKSSFAQASLVPALESHYRSERGLTARWAVFRPGASPFAALADALHAVSGARVSDLPPATAEARAALFDALRDATPPTCANLLVIDQFEEVFTQRPDDAARQALIDMLTALPRFATLRTHIIVTVRSDFLPELTHYPDLYALATSGIALRGMPEADLEDAIQGPLRALHGERKRFDPALLERLARDAAEDVSYLPLLQTTLESLWRGGSLTLDRYHGLATAVQRRADEVWAYRDPDGARLPRAAAERVAIMGIFLDLVDVSPDDQSPRDARRSRSRAELEANHPERAELVDELTTARLLSVRGGDEAGESRRDDERIDIIHESLIANWQRLRAALAGSREQLKLRAQFEQALRLWLDKAKADPYLLPPAAIEEARRLDRLNDVGLASALARSYLDRSVQREQRRQRRRLQIASGVALAILLLGVIATVFGFQARHDALVARSEALSANALNQMDSDPELGVILARYATDYALQSGDQTAIQQADNALRQTLLRPRASRTFSHRDVVNSAVFSPDGTRVLTASGDKTATLWSARDGRVLRTFHFDVPVYGAAFNPDGTQIVTATPDGEARVWSARDGRSLLSLVGHSGYVNDAEFSPDGSEIVTASADRSAKVWSSQDGRLLLTLTGHTDNVLSASFSADGSAILTASADGTVRVWSSQDGRTLLTIDVAQTGAVGVNRAAFSPDGSRILTAGGDSYARLWSAQDGHLIQTFAGHTSTVLSAAFTPDGTKVLTASGDSLAYLWCIGQCNTPIRTFSGHTGAVLMATFSHDGTRILTASADDTARIWSVKDLPPYQVFYGHSGAVHTAAFSADGTQLLTASADMTAKLWSLHDGRVVRTFAGHTGQVWSAEFSPDGTRIVTSSSDGTAKVWSADDGKPLLTLVGHTDVVWDAVFSPDGTQILTSSADGTARLWSAQDGHPVHTFPGTAGGEFGAAAFSPDGTEIATGSGTPGTITLWSAKDDRLLHTLSGHTGAVLSLCFSPDGTKVLSASADNTAKIWSAKDGRLLRTLAGHTGEVFAAVFSPDGSRILTASTDKSVRLWSAVDGHLVRTAFIYSDPVLGAFYSPRGDRFVVVSFFGVVIMQPVNLSDLLRAVSTLPLRPLTNAERSRYGL